MKKQLSNLKKQIRKKKPKAIKYRILDFKADQFADNKELDEFYHDIYEQFNKRHTKGKFDFATIQEIKKRALQGRWFFTQTESKGLIKVVSDIGFARFRSNKSKTTNGRIQILERFQYIVARKSKLNQQVRIVRLRDKIQDSPFKNILLIHFYNDIDQQSDSNDIINQMEVEEEVKPDLQQEYQLKLENQQPQQPFDIISAHNLLPLTIPLKQSDDFFEKIDYQKIKVEQDDNKQVSLDKEQERKIIEEQKKEIAQLKKENESHISEKFQYMKHISDLEIQIRQLLNENSDLGNKLRTIEINILKEMQKFQLKEVAMKKGLEQKKQVILIDDS